MKRQKDDGLAAVSDASGQWSETDVFPELSAPLLARKTANPLNG